MIFVIDNLKYDTDKMEMISNKISYEFTAYNILFGDIREVDREAKLYRSVKGRYLVVYGLGSAYASDCICEETAKKLLMKSDLNKYEELFGQLEEA